MGRSSDLMRNFPDIAHDAVADAAVGDLQAERLNGAGPAQDLAQFDSALPVGKEMYGESEPSGGSGQH